MGTEPSSGLHVRPLPLTRYVMCERPLVKLVKDITIAPWIRLTTLNSFHLLLMTD